MMTSWYGHIFCPTGHLWGNSWVQRWTPHPHPHPHPHPVQRWTPHNPPTPQPQPQPTPNPIPPPPTTTTPNPQPHPNTHTHKRPIMWSFVFIVVSGNKNGVADDLIYRAASCDVTLRHATALMWRPFYTNYNVVVSHDIHVNVISVI